MTRTVESVFVVVKVGVPVDIAAERSGAVSKAEESDGPQHFQSAALLVQTIMSLLACNLKAGSFLGKK